MAGTTLIDAVKGLIDDNGGHLSGEAQKALLLSKSLKAHDVQEYCLPSTQSINGFRSGRAEWAFDHSVSITTRQSSIAG